MPPGGQCDSRIGRPRGPDMVPRRPRSGSLGLGRGGCGVDPVSRAHPSFRHQSWAERSPVVENPCPTPIGKAVPKMPLWTSRSSMGTASSPIVVVIGVPRGTCDTLRRASMTPFTRHLPANERPCREFRSAGSDESPTGQEDAALTRERRARSRCALIALAPRSASRVRTASKISRCCML